ncbi:OVARIAN TUMOR DOMAIN-containing deubiquitinating enzyme 7-like [Venturia canescens]|uniref:OVARIAN TUMOR DOMAIN-containing deubiquitinating enzyme 7-like n=1 Tax=Venturia canescens TaxID=32260 RepID=UPI001C9CBDA8|nr:OVARIAN TUMOR DOMAIN-containing deubiquitinating enzyme 7-like [Venturia canescens]
MTLPNVLRSLVFCYFVFRPGTALLRSPEGTFRVHKIFGDGNCMFRAVSYVLWQSEDEHSRLRTLVTQHIKSHWREYGPFVTAEWSITEPEEYKNFMISEGVFATELECTVATKLHKMNLSIYREIHEGTLERVFHNSVNSSFETARLLFSGRPESGHYDVLTLVR